MKVLLFYGIHLNDLSIGLFLHQMKVNVELSNVLLSSFHLNGRTLGFYPQTKVRTTLYRIINSTTFKVLLNSFHLNGRTLGFYLQRKVRTTLYRIINHTTWKYCSIAFIWMVTKPKSVGLIQGLNSFQLNCRISFTNSYVLTNVYNNTRFHLGNWRISRDWLIARPRVSRGCHNQFPSND